MKKLLFFAALLCVASVALCQSGIVDTAVIFSQSNQVNMKAVIIKPTNYSVEDKRFPVVYLLHGYGGAYANWITRVPAIKEYADKYQVVIVCPNGENSWYINSPVKKASNFETYVTEELVGYLDKNYKTIANKRNRAIT
ncbi:MAG: esterase family protein, partial [Sphingobacteriales bacterium]